MKGLLFVIHRSIPFDTTGCFISYKIAIIQAARIIAKVKNNLIPQQNSDCHSACVMTTPDSTFSLCSKALSAPFKGGTRNKISEVISLY